MLDYFGYFCTENAEKQFLDEANAIVEAGVKADVIMSCRGRKAISSHGVGSGEMEEGQGGRGHPGLAGT